MLLIKNGKIMTMCGKTYDNGSILIKDGKIIDIGENIDITDEDYTVIDAKNYWVMPGIIEAHCHIGIKEERKGFEGDDCNEINEPITPYLRALDGINVMDSAFHTAITSGITGVMVGPGSSNVVGGQFAFIKTHGRVIDNMTILEPAAIKVAFGENIKTNYNQKNMVPSTRMSVAALLREELFNAKQYSQNKQNAMKNGDNFDKVFRKECWLPVINRDIPIKAHVHRADDILTAIRIAKEFNIRLTLDHCTEGHLIADEIKDSGFPAIVGPSLAVRNKIETQNLDFKTAGILHKAGVKVAITTDHPVTRIQDLPICAGFAAREGLGVEEGLKSITINAAEICNVSDRVGSIEIGKDADIAIFNGNPMEVFTKAMYTIIDGEVVYEAKSIKN
ncbi:MULTISPECIES: amidohydrolase [unclassified Romboutsia]|uniref:amidohydrolase n=1 Tax=unclassified Romboutsia TaxID=2626894 RepID=UPI0008202F31|nr:MULTISPECIES: amidohydrolase [unclassified Romboutsia]SCH86435.1 imidazolonepropionase [uncultured Clostridium sp.]